MADASLSLSYRRYALGLLLAVNLLNYIDRQVLFAVFPLIKIDLAISDTALGFLGSAFMFSYMLIAPLFGWLGDRWSRVKLAAGGLVVWSVATALAGFAPGYRTLLAARATVGVGEASFGTVSPGLIADFFDRERRGRVLSWFYLAIPVGSALGYLLGGILGERLGWHAAFLMVGLPGLALAIPIALLRTPPRGGEDAPHLESAGPGKALSPAEGYRTFIKNRSFVFNTIAMATMTFAIGGLAQWIPSFLYRTHAVSVEKGNTLFGAATVLAGILGTLIGGWLGDRWQKRTPKGYLLVSGWGFLAGTPFAAWALLAQDLKVCIAAIFVAEFFLFLNTGPLNTVIINVTHPAIRAMAFAVNIFFIHALGDAISPSILGWLSDHWGLRNALLSTPLVMALAGIFCFVCGRYIEEDMKRAEVEPS
ncbi:MFS transporter [Geomonas sp. Red32]|uniref:spinster family MFS transporter n=1 Tax=Geomonas sp. Red32 TaxID=2912856 RepID=UPI00202CE79F|nr:MFS transporter [Geomonas sp. Red32]MCM0083077.1 MFS transporter [Geomonas sp. Red32]